jgi:UDP-N-acetylglucosamine 2-epimerase (non-hydrolysing)
MEAGLRAWDNRMPEQRNRILIDHMSDILLPFHRYHRENLIRENIHPSKIFITGNPTYEAMWAFLPKIRESDILKRLQLEPRQYLLITAHRSENVDNPAYLEAILKALGELHRRFKREVIYPMHPRTRSKLGKRDCRRVRIIAASFSVQLFSGCVLRALRLGNRA